MSHTVTSDSGLLSRKIIPGHFVRVHDHAKEAPIAATQSTTQERPKEPKITLHRDNGTVKTIEIQCTCGEVIRLDCDYA